MIQLRDYQEAALERGKVCIRESLTGSPMHLNFGTGLGKTTVGAKLAQWYLANYPGRRVVVVVHTADILDQWCAAWSNMTGTEAGVEMASERSRAHQRFVVASWKSLHADRIAYLGNVGLVIHDEAHLAGAPTWLGVQDYFRGQNCHQLYISATLCRWDRSPLPYDMGRCIGQMDLLAGVRDGWLVRPVATQLRSRVVSLAGIKHGTHDYDQAELAARVNVSPFVLELADTIAHYTDGGKRSFIVYVPTVDPLAFDLAAHLERAYSISAAAICGDQVKCPKDVRKTRLRRFAEGALRGLVNVDVLSAGWDCPHLDTIILAAFTKSWPRYMQRIGRGSRTLPGTLDHCRNAEERLAAIARSAKPVSRIIDIVDVTDEHTLQTAVTAFAPQTLEKGRLRQIRRLGAGREDVDVLETVQRAADAWNERQAQRVGSQAKAVVDRAERSVDLTDEDRLRLAGPAKPTGRPRPGEYVLEIGIHAGKKIKDVPTDYLTWLSTHTRNKELRIALSMWQKARAAANQGSLPGMTDEEASLRRRWG